MTPGFSDPGYVTKPTPALPGLWLEDGLAHALTPSARLICTLAHSSWTPVWASLPRPSQPLGCCSARASSLHDSFPLTPLLAATPQPTRGLGTISFASGPWVSALHPQVLRLLRPVSGYVTGQSLVPSRRRLKGQLRSKVGEQTQINRNRRRGRGGGKSGPTGAPTITVASFKL